MQSSHKKGAKNRDRFLFQHQVNIRLSMLNLLNIDFILNGKFVKKNCLNDVA